MTKYYDSLGRQVEETLKIGSTGALRATSSDWDSLYRSEVTYPGGRTIGLYYHDSGALMVVNDSSSGGLPG